MSDFAFGGAGNSISKLCLNLSKKNYKISIICIGKCGYSKIFKKNNITVYELNSKKLIFSIFLISNLLKKIVKKKYKNILISNIHYNNVILTLIAKRINNLKTVLVERTPLEELDIYFSNIDYLKKKILKFLVNLVYPLSDIIIANSVGIKKGFNNSLSNKVKVIYPPSLDKLNKSIKKIPKKNVFKAVCFSRLSKEKNLECAIKSFVLIKKKNISLTIFGDGDLKNNLISLINSLNIKKKVKIRKVTRFPQKEMKKFDILISPSFFEGCSNTIIEALNNNLVVIASNCPGGNSEILSNRSSGLLFETNNEYDLSIKINKILKNFKFYLNKSKKNRQNLKKFLLNSNVKKYSNIFESI